MRPPAMCPECERRVAMTYLGDGAAAAVLLFGREPCPHVVTAFGCRIIPDPAVPPSFIHRHFPHPLVLAAYSESASSLGGEDV